MTTSQYDCAIVIPSCDSYEEAWGPFFGFFFKYWPDCPFPIYLITETKKFDDPRVQMINLGKDFGWANNMIKSLAIIPENNFIYFLEDVFIMKKVDTARVLSLLNLLKKDTISCLRLFPLPGPSTQYGDTKDLGLIAQNAEYRVSTMPAIWNKAAFSRLLVAGENAWQMELDGTKRAHAMNELFVSVWPGDAVIDIFATAIKRGRWLYDAVQLCHKEGIPVKPVRPVESFNEYVIRKACYLPVIGGFFRVGHRWYHARGKKK
ncbi:MAG: hypothetical protein V4524_02650 [Patescibacteria group bacterium]